MAVFVLDRNGKALMPCTERRAKLLLARNRARVHRLLPFAIRLIDRHAISCEFQALRIKLDPGSKATGIALVREVEDGSIAVLNLFELIHRGRQVSEALTARRSMRRRRRAANTRYRAPRFLNRGNKQSGWLAPSLQHRVDTMIAWVNRLSRLASVSALSQELARFDMQAMESPAIAGVEYQQGTLAGYEVREYLLEKFNHTCAYCDAKDTPLQIEHIDPKVNGGSNRISNLTLACGPCNLRKAAQDINTFLKKEPVRLAKILAQVKKPLKDAAAVNSTRWALFNTLKTTGLSVEVASGGRTKYNRVRLNIPKTHALDAVCVGVVQSVQDWVKPMLTIKSMGRGCYQRTRLNAYGFPRGYLTRVKNIEGFQTGDMVKASVIKGKKIGIYTGRVAVRATGNFNIQTATEVVQGISHRYCKVIQRGDGYGYSQSGAVNGSSRVQVGSRVMVASQPALYLTALKGDVSRAIR
ncbi:MAG: RNA-guided endonuclease IscB [Methylotenera sp.]|nr:RNA-guided endonuclease IscB [Methylotenera sp.]MDP3060404.1 RNA-guided endonuclease IscB [Methylotenera sp.]